MENDNDCEEASMLSHTLDIWLGQDDLRAGELLSDDFSTLENARDLVLYTRQNLKRKGLKRSHRNWSQMR